MPRSPNRKPPLLEAPGGRGSPIATSSRTKRMGAPHRRGRTPAAKISEKLGRLRAVWRLVGELKFEGCVISGGGCGWRGSRASSSTALFIIPRYAYFSKQMTHEWRRSWRAALAEARRPFSGPAGNFGEIGEMPDSPQRQSTQSPQPSPFLVVLVLVPAAAF